MSHHKSFTFSKINSFLLFRRKCNNPPLFQMVYLNYVSNVLICFRNVNNIMFFNLDFSRKPLIISLDNIISINSLLYKLSWRIKLAILLEHVTRWSSFYYFSLFIILWFLLSSKRERWLDGLSCGRHGIPENLGSDICGK